MFAEKWEQKKVKFSIRALKVGHKVLLFVITNSSVFNYSDCVTGFINLCQIQEVPLLQVVTQPGISFNLMSTTKTAPQKKDLKKFIGPERQSGPAMLFLLRSKS